MRVARSKCRIQANTLQQRLKSYDSRLEEIRRVNHRLEDDLARLRGRVTAMQNSAVPSPELDALRTECERARAEVAALRSSLSWKLAAPLRAVYDWIRPAGRSSDE